MIKKFYIPISSIIILISLLFVYTNLHSQFEQSISVICKIMDEDGNPLPGVVFWYKEDTDYSEWKKASNVASRDTNLSLDYYGTVGGGYPHEFQGRPTNLLAKLYFHIPSESSRRALIKLTKSGYRKIEDSIHVKGTDYYGVAWYKVYIMEERYLK